MDSISLSASIADYHHTYESVADRGSVPIPRCHAEGSAEMRSFDQSARSVEKKIAFIFHFSRWALVAHSCFALLSSTCSSSASVARKAEVPLPVDERMAHLNQR